MSANSNLTDVNWISALTQDDEGNTSEFALNTSLGVDGDADGIIDALETGTGAAADESSSPTSVDTDGDGLPDSVEDRNKNGLCDQDLGETCAYLADTDGDGVSDWAETHGDGMYDPGYDTNPLSADTDGDGIPDGDEDKNHNGIWDGYLKETSPLLKDSDGDGRPDNNDICPSIPNPGQEPWFCS